MKEYIERGKFLKECMKTFGNMGVTVKAIEGIANECAADVEEVRHGAWHYNPNGMDWGLGAWECSLCRCRNDNLPMDEKINPRVWAGTKFCPNCGAKMDGKRKEQEDD